MQVRNSIEGVQVGKFYGCEDTYEGNSDLGSNRERIQSVIYSLGRRVGHLDEGKGMN